MNKKQLLNYARESLEKVQSTEEAFKVQLVNAIEKIRHERVQHHMKHLRSHASSDGKSVINEDLTYGKWQTHLMQGVCHLFDCRLYITHKGRQKLYQINGYSIDVDVCFNVLLYCNGILRYIAGNIRRKAKKELHLERGALRSMVTAHLDGLVKHLINECTKTA
jgi:hypothetical protein